MYIQLVLCVVVWNLCIIYRECKSIKLTNLSLLHPVAKYSPSYEKATVTPITW